MTSPSANDLPLVSIVIPVYNGSNYLAQAIDSALTQTYPHCEVIVVNDGSQDSGQSERIARSYGDRIRYLTKTNGGVASALNLGLSIMHGAFFSWLSHDDLYEPDKIERQCAMVLGAPPGDVIVYSNYYIFSDDGRRSTVRLHDTDPQGFRYRLARRSNINGCTLLIPAKALREAGGFNEALRTTQDYEMWFRLARQCTFIHHPAALVGSRFHRQQGIFTQGSRADIECRALHALFARELRDDEMPTSPGNNLGRAYNDLAKAFWSRGFDEAARIAQQRAATNGLGALQRVAAKWAGCTYHGIALLLRQLLDPRIRVWLRQLPLTKTVLH